VGCGERGEGGVSVYKWDCGARVGFGDIWVGTLGGGDSEMGSLGTICLYIYGCI